MRLIVFRKVLVFKSTSKIQYPNSVWWISQDLLTEMFIHRIFTYQYQSLKNIPAKGLHCQSWQRRIKRSWWTISKTISRFPNLGILVCLSTGLRIGEVCALKWSDINMDTGLLHVNRTIERIYIVILTSHIRRLWLILLRQRTLCVRFLWVKNLSEFLSLWWRWWTRTTMFSRTTQNRLSQERIATILTSYWSSWIFRD